MAMTIQTKDIIWISGTPLGYSVYSAKSLSTQLQESVLEIIMCMKGSIKFSYSYEEFVLHEGEFISVDKDAYYLDEGKNNICVSIYLRQEYFYEKYPQTHHSMFICEGMKDASVPFPTAAHLELQSLILGLLSCLLQEPDKHIINQAADKIMKQMVSNFDILFYRRPKEQFNANYIRRHYEIQSFLWKHLYEPITLKDLAEHFHLTESYISEFIRKSGLSFKKMMAYIRANASEKVLLTTNKSIAEVAELCGFSDVKLYYAAFRQWYRCTPKQFRDKYKYGIKDDLEYLSITETRGPIMRISLQNHKEKLVL